MWHDTTLVKHHRCFWSIAVQCGQALSQLLATQCARGYAAISTDSHDLLANRGGPIALAQGDVTAAAVHDVIAEPARQATPEPQRVAEQPGPLRRGEGGPHQGAVATGGATLPIAGIEHPDVANAPFGQAERKHEALDAAANDCDGRPRSSNL